MTIHQLLKISYVNGPGARFVVWVQGCFRNCPGCFNPGTHDRDGGCKMEISDIVSEIPPESVTGITVSGGEPFDQPDDLALLLEEAGKKGLNRLVYSGYTYEELLGHKNSMVAKSLSLIDILIDGPYERQIPPYMPWTGSGNQRVLELQNGVIKKTCKKSDYETKNCTEGELIINRDGSITATGMIDSKTIYDKLENG